MIARIVRIIGPIIDIDSEDYFPKINEIIEVEVDVKGVSKILKLMVSGDLGTGRIRTIPMNKYEGLVCDMEIKILNHGFFDFSKKSLINF